MKFVIFTHVPHYKVDNSYFAYSPYVREMNIWGKNVNEFIVVAPLSSKSAAVINSPYSHQNLTFISVPSFDIVSVRSFISTIFKLPGLLWTMYKAMRLADHIHLRCPGNMGLLGCIVQVLFPKVPKSAKYAGNWDPQSKQPLSYKLQQHILSNTFFTRNMKVLVYGEWANSSKNIVPFFTATYSEMEKIAITQKKLQPVINFIFVGTLTKGKNPLYAIQLIESLYHKGYQVRLQIYGEGKQRKLIEDYLLEQQLENVITLNGNQSKEVLLKAYQDRHFGILPSESEGWPKAIAEGMFYGCVPIATKVSCVSFMLDYGNRGLLLHMDLENDCLQMESVLKNQPLYEDMQNRAATWSQKYTTEVFESEIIKILK